MNESQRFLDDVVDPGTFEQWQTVSKLHPRDPAYEAELESARLRTQLPESVITGTATIGGHRAAVIVGEFRFLGGSIGVDAAETITSAVMRATSERLPILAAPVSGGTRMQEGTVAFLQMVKITAAITAHKRAGLPYVVYLRNPTTGGVYASWGSMGHVTLAEPGALIGLLGPRVYEVLHGAPFPTGVQTAENLSRLGLVDAVVELAELGVLVTKILDVLRPPRPHDAPEEAQAVANEPISDWDVVVHSRKSDRPGFTVFMKTAATSVVYLNGAIDDPDRIAGDRGLTLAVARIGGRGVVVVGQDRDDQVLEGALGPGALRTARRGIRLAEQLGLPLLTIIDTPGAALSREAEEGGLAREVALCLAALLDTTAPTVSVVLGQGAGAGALALIPADTVIAAQNSWLAPLPPEGASAIVYRDDSHAPEMSGHQRIAAHHLLDDGIVDVLVPEYPSAELEPERFSQRLTGEIDRAFQSLDVSDAGRRVRRLERYRRVGSAPLTSRPLTSRT